MALELGQLPEGQALPGLAVPADTTDTSSCTDDAAAQATIPDLTSLGLALPVIPPLPPALTLSTQPADAGLSPLSTGFVQLGTGRAAMAPAAQQNTLAVHKDLLAAQQNTVAAQQNPLAAHQDLLAQASAAAKTELQFPATPDAEDAGLSGKPLPPAISEIGRESTLVSGLPQEHAPAHAIHAGSAGLVQTAPVQTAPAPVAALETRVGERGWDHGLGDKLVWMASHKQQVAELHLNPPDLGPLKITLTLNQDQASAQFVSAHAAVREAIESAMPRLRDMLAENGITLGNANVSTDAFREQAQPHQDERAYQAAPAAAAADPGTVTRGERLLVRARGLVDTFA
jgi:flagellar hook-length control protein FliK